MNAALFNQWIVQTVNTVAQYFIDKCGKNLRAFPLH